MRILDSVREKIPNAAITTDIIVGFPGETEEDFLGTMDIVRRARVLAGLHFPVLHPPRDPRRNDGRSGAQAHCEERFERLTALQDEISWEENTAQIGREVEVLVTTRPHDDSPRLTGRSADNRLVHVGIPDGEQMPRPGDFVTATVTDAKPFFLLADSGYSVRPSRAGDAYDRAQADSCGTPTSGQTSGASTNLGMPTIRTRS